MRAAPDRGHSSVGRAPDLHSGGRRFDPCQLHSVRFFLFFDNLEIGKIESPSPVIQCSQVIFKNNTLVKLLRVYGGCLGTWRR